MVNSRIRTVNMLLLLCNFLGNKYILGADSLIIRNFDYYDQGVYYCRAFITLKTDFLSKIYPIFVQLQSKIHSIGQFFFVRTKQQ